MSEERRCRCAKTVDSRDSLCFFQSDLWLAEGRKSRLAKAAGAEPSGQMRAEKIARRCGAGRISRSEVVQNMAGSGRLLEVDMLDKVHAIVVPSTCPSQNLQSTPCPDHVCRFRCGFVWQVQGIAHLFKSELCVKVL